MTVDELVAYCLGKPGAEETYPFGENVLVAKVGGSAFPAPLPCGPTPRAFAFLGLEEPVAGVKCGRDQDEADEWRARHPDAITPMRYLARYGWNSVAADRVPDDEVRELVDGSYDDVVSRLPRSRRPCVSS